MTLAGGCGIETWTVVQDGRHNAFTDLAFWRSSFWLAYISSPTHFFSRRSRVVILRSRDARAWRPAACLDGDGEDIRDPKLAVVGDRLVLVALLNRRFDPQPYRTVTAASADGRTWSPRALAAPAGWLLGRPKLAADGAWYAPAHNLVDGGVKLFASADGLAWEAHAAIARGDGADETAIEPLPDGRLLAVTRLEAGGGLGGHPRAGTLISAAAPPYTTWSPLGCSRLTRLDGPALFAYGDRVFAAGRFQPRVAGPIWWSGSVLSRKRTSLFALRGGRLTRVADLPSAGDTSYPGVVTRDGQAFISYYTSPPRRDGSWLTAMFLPTSIRMAAVPLDLPAAL